jgi:hypothetical protein
MLLGFWDPEDQELILNLPWKPTASSMWNHFRKQVCPPRMSTREEWIMQRVFMSALWMLLVSDRRVERPEHWSACLYDMLDELEHTRPHHELRDFWSTAKSVSPLAVAPIVGQGEE